MPYSVTKPFAAVCVLRLVDAGRSTSTPRCSATGPSCAPPPRSATSCRTAPGIVVLDEEAPEEAFYDWDLMCSLLAGQEPAWAPGTAQGESALFYGHLLGQVVRRVDGRSLGSSCARRSAARWTWTSTSGSVTPSWPGSPT